MSIFNIGDRVKVIGEQFRNNEIGYVTKVDGERCYVEFRERVPKLLGGFESKLVIASFHESKLEAAPDDFIERTRREFYEKRAAQEEYLKEMAVYMPDENNPRIWHQKRNEPIETKDLDAIANYISNSTYCKEKNITTVTLKWSKMGSSTNTRALDGKAQQIKDDFGITILY